MKIDWKKGPGFKRIEQINIPPYEEFTLSNGIPGVLLESGTQEVFRLEMIYVGARLIEHKKIVSRFTAALMREGTKNFTSIEIAEAVDFYGATLRIAANLDHSYITLTGLSKHFENLMPILTDILYHPLFHEDELEKFKKNSLQKLQMDLSKNEMLNYRVFTETLFGSEHIYGYNTEEAHINDIQQQDLVRHHTEAFGSDNCHVYIGGRLPDNTKEILNKYLGQNKIETAKYKPLDEVSLLPHHRILVPSKNEHQASIRIGRKMFKRNHPDFAGVFMLNTILGGYFGSRLMTTIREDMGLTYSIYSVMDQLIYDGYFYIETEVTQDNIDKTIAEVYKQIDILKSVLVDIEELTMVKNYLLGNFLNLVDGPFNTLSFIKSTKLDGSSKEDFDDLVSYIKRVEAKELQDIAIKYLSKEDMIEVIISNLPSS